MNTLKTLRSKPHSTPATAFLALSIVSQANMPTQDGLQLRDYFAGKVMAQIQEQWPKGHRDGWDGMAAMAYSYADAMIRVRVHKLREEN
jgi:hypothetical protein